MEACACVRSTLSDWLSWWPRRAWRQPWRAAGCKADSKRGGQGGSRARSVGACPRMSARRPPSPAEAGQPGDARRW
jgi:hypothetical protein